MGGQNKACLSTKERAYSSGRFSDRRRAKTCAVPFLRPAFFVLKGVLLPMLPCKPGCQRYREGCHKTCVKWKMFLAKKRTEQQRKKAYLTYHSERCNAVVQQCYQNHHYTVYR